MGYTSYFYRPATLPKIKWNKFVQEVLMLQKNLPATGITAGDSYGEHPLEIAGWNPKAADGGEYEKGYPILEDEQIAFNGAGQGLDHESLVISRLEKQAGHRKHEKLIFNFCKTNRKPYDNFVCLTLISFKRWFGNSVEVSSDGDQKDWQPAIDLYTKLTSVPITYGMVMKEKKKESTGVTL